MGPRILSAACAALLIAAAPALAADANVRAHGLVAKMTQEEKFGLMSGACDPHGHTGFVQGIPRLGIPDLSLNDGPVGVHEEPPTALSQDVAGACATFQYGEVGEGRSTQMPAPLALAATFDDSLAHAYGAVPFAVAGTGVNPAGQQSYDEPTAAASGLAFDPGHGLITWFLARGVRPV